MWGQFWYCLWTWLMSFFYSANSIVLPVFIRQVFGQTNFVENVGFLWLSYPVGSVLITILVKALFGTIHFPGFSIVIAFCHFISFYTAHSMKKSHNNYLLKQASKTKRVGAEEEEPPGSFINTLDSNIAPVPKTSINVSQKEQPVDTYNALKTVLSL